MQELVTGRELALATLAVVEEVDQVVEDQVVDQEVVVVVVVVVVVAMVPVQV